jgi:nicotinamidase/pyrazinamidase
MPNVTLDRDHTASLDVDAQKGFTPLCPQELPVPQGDEIVAELNAQARAARYRIGSKDAHCRAAMHIATAEHPQYSPVGAPNTDIHWNAHCIMGTPGAELLPGLPHWLDYDYFVFKGIEPDAHPYGACYHDLGDTRSTGMIEYLRQNKVDTVLVGGLATDFCVKTSVLQLRKAGFRVVVNLAACRGIGIPADGGKTSIDAAIAEMRAAGTEFVNNGADLFPKAAA